MTMTTSPRHISPNKQSFCWRDKELRVHILPVSVFFVTFLFLGILFYSCHLVISVIITGDAFLVFSTFGLIYVIDQCK